MHIDVHAAKHILDEQQKKFDMELNAMRSAGKSSEELEAKRKEFLDVYQACTREALKFVRFYRDE